MKKKLFVIIPLLIVFAVGVYFAVTDAFVEYELEVARLLNPKAGSNGLMKFVTDIGEAVPIIGIIIILLAVPSTRLSVGLPAGLTALFSRLVNSTVKDIIARPRPEERLLEISSYSFPSGHAMNSSAFYIVLMLLILRLCNKKSEKIIISVFFITLVFLIGISRVYFNVHYISDVVSGWCLGTVIAILADAIYGYALSRGKNAEN